MGDIVARLDQHALELDELHRGLDGLAERIDALQDETGRRVADELDGLRNRIVTLELANKGLVALIEQEAVAINDRITDVHTKALRELTRRAERRPTA